MTVIASFVAQQGGTSGITFLVSLVLLVGVFYFLLIRPQQRRMRAQRDLITSLSVGDEVVSIGGIFGRITAMDDESVTLTVAPGTEVRFVKNAIARRLVEETDQEAGGAP